jgi:hypothetical protein
LGRMLERYDHNYLTPASVHFCLDYTKHIRRCRGLVQHVKEVG